MCVCTPFPTSPPPSSSISLFRLFFSRPPAFLHSTLFLFRTPLPNRTDQEPQRYHVRRFSCYHFSTFRFFVAFDYRLPTERKPNRTKATTPVGLCLTQPFRLTRPSFSRGIITCFRVRGLTFLCAVHKQLPRNCWGRSSSLNGDFPAAVMTC